MANHFGWKSCNLNEITNLVSWLVLHQSVPKDLKLQRDCCSAKDPCFFVYRGTAAMPTQPPVSKGNETFSTQNHIFCFGAKTEEILLLAFWKMLKKAARLASNLKLLWELPKFFFLSKNEAIVWFLCFSHDAIFKFNNADIKRNKIKLRPLSCTRKELEIHC